MDIVVECLRCVAYWFERCSVCLSCAVYSFCDQLDTRCQWLNQSGSECLWNTSFPFAIIPFSFSFLFFFKSPLFTRLFLGLLHLQASLAISRLLFTSHCVMKMSSSVRLFLCHPRIPPPPPLPLFPSHYSGASARLASLWRCSPMQVPQWPGL